MFGACGDQNSAVFGGLAGAKHQASEPGSNTAQNVPKQVAPRQRTFKTNKLAKKIQNQIKEFDEVEIANAGGNIQFNDLTVSKSPKVTQHAPNLNYVHPGHQSFNIVFNIMLGIKKSVDATFDIPLLQLTDKDYKIRCQYEIAPYRTEASDVVKACTFFDYAPQIFASIRKVCGISKQQYSESLGPEQILCYMFNANFRTLAELCSSGKSGSFFYYTQDSRFVLKTIPRSEFKFMKSILKNYHEYLTRHNHESLISKVLGIHKVIFYRKKHKMSRKTYFCIMDNVFSTQRKIDIRYDLKGSTFGRSTD